ncbi:Otoancorin, partial [Varanus komodoensis]
EEVIAGKYLHALLDMLQFQSTHMWTTDLLNKIVIYFHSQNYVMTYSNLQVSIKKYLENFLYHPKVLLAEFQQMNQQHFQAAMKYLFGSKQSYLELGNIVIDLATIRERIFQSPGGNRTLFLITLERCFLTLNPVECVDILSQVLRTSSISYLQSHAVTLLPRDLQEDAFRNLSTVFKDLYDRMTANAQRALYLWMTQILQKFHNTSGSGNDTSWVSAESMWILGRYMVLLPLEEIKKINPYEMRLFISYDNATKQLDTVYDITPDLAQAFLERINASGFDMKNTSTLYRQVHVFQGCILEKHFAGSSGQHKQCKKKYASIQKSPNLQHHILTTILGLLVCFYNDLEQIDASVARALLHQMMKCNQLRGFQADIQKLKSQLLSIAMQNQTLNDTLGSLSDAVVGLTTLQLESLSPEAVQNAIQTLNQISGWAKSQVMILSSKYLMHEKVLLFHNISQMGALVTGISTHSFHNMNPKELAQVIRGTLAQRMSDLSPAQQHGILRKLITSTELWPVITDLQGAFFKEVSLFDLWKEERLNSSLVKEKELRPSQALYLYDVLSKKTLPSDLLSITQLLKGVTCLQIENMNAISFLNTFSIFEKNLHLLSPYQINCLAWKFWTVSNESVPPYLLTALPVEHLESIIGSLCVPFVASLGKVELDHLIKNRQKKKAILQKVQDCMNGSVADEYDIDLLGSLICHLPAAFVCEGISLEAGATALDRFRSCQHLGYNHKMEIKHRLMELHGDKTLKLVHHLSFHVTEESYAADTPASHLWKNSIHLLSSQVWRWCELNWRCGLQISLPFLKAKQNKTP